MIPQKTIKKLLEEKCNDYSKFEPFSDSTPIQTSIIIPVYNNAGIFRLTLSSLTDNESLRENREDIELVVVDDGSKEDIGTLFDSFNFPFSKRLIKLPANKGRSSARNAGINNASNELLVFLDADIVVPKNYFAETWKVHNKMRNAISVGLAKNIYHDEILSWSTNLPGMPNIEDDFRYQKTFPKGRFDREEYRLLSETNWFKNFGFEREIGPWTLPKMVITHNVGVRKEQVKEVGGFDERFRTWGYEDSHFGAKMIANGCYVVPLKNTGIWRILLRDKNRRFSSKNLALYNLLISEEST